ncbi:hypothetical protein BDY24DRAFT_421061 [Mrakia frigida]|uniref:uncharacterized protein n=1 Tax=Mrakia frigida TaxID=29902 RepID=UPI003FCBF0C3
METTRKLRSGTGSVPLRASPELTLARLLFPFHHKSSSHSSSSSSNPSPRFNFEASVAKQFPGRFPLPKIFTPDGKEVKLNKFQVGNLVRYGEGHICFDTIDGVEPLPNGEWRIYTPLIREEGLDSTDYMKLVRFEFECPVCLTPDLRDLKKHLQACLSPEVHESMKASNRVARNRYSKSLRDASPTSTKGIKRTSILVEERVKYDKRKEQK